jgi:hypothetical protein
MAARRALCALLAATTATAQHLSARLLSVSIDATSGVYNVTLRDTVAGGDLIFTSTPLLVLYNGSTLSSGDGSLVRVGGSTETAGSDGMGSFTRVALAWGAPAHPAFAFTTAFRAYASAGPDGACALVFEQQFDSGIPVTARPGLPRASAKALGLVAAFPSLQLRLPPASPALGLLTYQGTFAGAGWAAGAWPPVDAPPGWVAVPDWDVVPALPNASYALHGPTASALACGTACAANASCAGVYTWSAVTAECYFKLAPPAWGGVPYARRFSGCNPAAVAGCPPPGAPPPAAGGFSTGPHVLVCPSRGCHAVLSPLTHAPVGFQVLRGDGSLASGTQDGAATVPPGYAYETLLSATGASAVPRAGARGPPPAVADALYAWGGAMLAFHGKPRTRPDAHAVISSLGYCTNAWYFYCALDGRNSTVGNLAEMHVAVQSEAARAQLPFRFHFLTSQFYGEHEYAMGVSLWDDSGFGHMPQRFPPRAGGGPGGGMAAMWAALDAGGLRGVSAHLGRWRGDTPYAAANASWEWLTAAAGGAGGTAVPLAAEFWAQLLGRAAREWGLIVLEQDHMDDTLGAVSGLLATVDGYERWLDGQGAGAAGAGVAVEYCMDFPSVVMHSAAVPAATHSRGGADYVPGQNAWQWDVTVPSALLHGLGLFVSKDTYYSSAAEANPRPKAGGFTDDCPFGSNFTEAYPATHHLAAVLSRGLVQPSDGVAQWDAPLLRTAARSDGLLLKPDAPARRVEATWERLMFGDPAAPAPGGALSTTFTAIGGAAWHFVLAVALAAPYNFTPADLLLPGGFGGGYLAVPFDWAPPGPYGWSLAAPQRFGDAAPLLLTPGASYSPAAYLLAPLLPAAVVVFGEVGKVAAMSAQRTTAFSQDAASGVVTLTFTGDAAGEDVVWGFACTNAALSAPQTQTCRFPASNVLIIDCSASAAASCATAKVGQVG